MFDKDIRDTNALQMNSVDTVVTHCLKYGTAESALANIFFNRDDTGDFYGQRANQIRIQGFDKPTIDDGG